MIITPQMGLKVWNLLSDLFDHTALSDNWNAVDGHDHTNGNGPPIPTGGLANSAVTTSKLAAGAVTSPIIATQAVTQVKIADGAVSTAKLADGAVTSTEIRDATITSADVSPTGGLSFYAADLLGNLSPSIAGRLLRATDTKQWLLDNGLGLDVMGFTAVTTPTSMTAQPGQIIQSTTASAITVSLPVSPQNSIIGVVAASIVTGAAPVTVSILGGGRAFGTGLTSSGATSFKLGSADAYVLLLNIDGINWTVIAGAPDTGWIALNLDGNGTAVAGWPLPQARLVSDVVWFRGSMKLTGNVGVGTGLIGPLPASMVPSWLNVAVPFGYAFTGTTGWHAYTGANIINAVLPTPVSVSEPTNVTAPIDLPINSVMFLDAASYTITP